MGLALRPLYERQRIIQPCRTEYDKVGKGACPLIRSKRGNTSAQLGVTCRIVNGCVLSVIALEWVTHQLPTIPCSQHAASGCVSTASTLIKPTRPNRRCVARRSESGMTEKSRRIAQ